MPEPFQPEDLRSLLRPLAAGEDESPAVRAYRTYYGLDPSERHPEARTRLGSFEAAGYRIATQVWLPTRPVATLLMLHGYYDHMGLYRHVVDWALGAWVLGFGSSARVLKPRRLAERVLEQVDEMRAIYAPPLPGLPNVPAPRGQKGLPFTR